MGSTKAAHSLRYPKERLRAACCAAPRRTSQRSACRMQDRMRGARASSHLRKDARCCKNPARCWDRMLQARAGGRQVERAGGRGGWHGRVGGSAGASGQRHGLADFTLRGRVRTSEGTRGAATPTRTKCCWAQREVHSGRAKAAQGVQGVQTRGMQGGGHREGHRGVQARRQPTKRASLAREKHSLVIYNL